MPSALLLSRLALSVLMIMFVALALLSGFRNIRTASLRNWSWNGLLVLLFLLPFISSIWTTNRAQWLQAIQIKLPLFFLPLGFMAVGQIPKIWLRRIVWSFILCAVLASAWSITGYLLSSPEVEQNYLRSTLMLTALSNDHVRFSWMVAIAALGAMLLSQEEAGKLRIWLLRGMAIFLVLYLHLLAARTGLLAFYMAAIGWLLVRSIRNRKPGPAILAAGILLLPVFAFWMLPTFQNRVRYVLYDFGFFSKAHYATGMNDAIRVISWRGGWNVWKQSALIGTGFGDLQESLKTWYLQEYPAMLPTEYLLPGNEWLVYMAATGIAGGLLIISLIIAPFLLKKSGPGVLIGACLPALLLFDAALEVQYGVFLFCFVTLFAQSWLQSSEQDCT